MNGPPAPLGDLRDLHLPDPVPFWPPAPGWWLLAGALSALLLVAGAWLYRRHRRLAYQRQARRELRALREDYRRHTDTPRLLRELSMLLRRVALARHPRAQVAGLHGAAWLDFLDKTGQTQDFSRGAGQVLADAPYRRAAPAVDAPRLLDLAEAWVRRQ